MLDQANGSSATTPGMSSMHCDLRGASSRLHVQPEGIHTPDDAYFTLGFSLRRVWSSLWASVSRDMWAKWSLTRLGATLLAFATSTRRLRTVIGHAQGDQVCLVALISSSRGAAAHLLLWSLAGRSTWAMGSRSSCPSHFPLIHHGGEVVTYWHNPTAGESKSPHWEQCSSAEKKNP